MQKIIAYEEKPSWFGFELTILGFLAKTELRKFAPGKRWPWRVLNLGPFGYHSNGLTDCATVTHGDKFANLIIMIVQVAAWQAIAFNKKYQIAFSFAVNGRQGIWLEIMGLWSDCQKVKQICRFRQIVHFNNKCDSRIPYTVLISLIYHPNNKINLKIFDSEDIENIYDIEMWFWRRTLLFWQCSRLSHWP